MLPLCRTPGDIVVPYAGAKSLSAEHLEPVGQGPEVVFKGGVVLGPVTCMLFRPEEVHTSSPVGPAIRGARNLSIGIPNHSFGFNGKHFFVSHFDYDRLSTIQTRGIYAHCLAGKKPANRQRFQSSLGKPTLLAIYRDGILGRQVVEGSKGDDVVPRVEPHRYSAIC